MTARPRPGLTLAVAAAALAGTTPLAPLAAADDEPLVEHCYTTALTAEQVAAGEVSEIDCEWVSPDEPPMQMRSGITYAIVYDTDQSGSLLGINSPSGVTTCTGGSAVFGTGSAWDNRIGSTELLACGAAKHWQWSNFSGNNQLVMGAGYTPMNGTMNNATSSIDYAP
ncbi:MAG TPA: hypothetical protein VF728_01725 [Nocardioides sp.]